MEDNRFAAFEPQEQTLIWTALAIAIEVWQKDAGMMLKGSNPSPGLAAAFEGYVKAAEALREEIDGEQEEVAS
jgi:hypothetical protein